MRQFLRGEMVDQGILPWEATVYLNWRYRGELPAPMYDMPADEMMMILAIQSDVELDYPI